MANPLEKLIHSFSKLPGVGQKTAARYAFHVLRSNVSYAQELAQAVLGVKQGMRECSACQQPAATDPCSLCADARRNSKSICVVEEVADLRAIENSGAFRGVYHILHGHLSPLDGIGPDELRIVELIKRLNGTLSDVVVEEVILATNPTVEGEATATYICQLVKPLGIKVSRIASGIPLGGEVEYVDARTLAMALEDRRTL